MDAPPTQYRFVERGRKLIVLDAATNLPPKQACDIHPAGHGLQSRERQDREATVEVPRVAEPDPNREPAIVDEPQAPSPDSFESAMDDMFFKGGGESRTQPFPKGVGTFIFVMVAAIWVGGFTGFLIAAVAIIVAGTMAFRRVGKRR